MPEKKPLKGRQEWKPKEKIDKGNTRKKRGTETSREVVQQPRSGDANAYPWPNNISRSGGSNWQESQAHISTASRDGYQNKEYAVASEQPFDDTLEHARHTRSGRTHGGYAHDGSYHDNTHANYEDDTEGDGFHNDGTLDSQSYSAHSSQNDNYDDGEGQVSAQYGQSLGESSQGSGHYYGYTSHDNGAYDNAQLASAHSGHYVQNVPRTSEGGAYTDNGIEDLAPGDMYGNEDDVVQHVNHDEGYEEAVFDYEADGTVYYDDGRSRHHHGHQHH